MKQRTKQILMYILLLVLCISVLSCQKEPDAEFNTGKQPPSTIVQNAPVTEQSGEQPSEQPGEQPNQQPNEQPDTQPQEPQEPQESQEHAHLFENGRCTGCNEVIYTVLSNGNIAFGAYPQSKVEDTALCTDLSIKAGALPTAADCGTWSAFADEEHFWYIDLTHDGERYRGIYFTEYRPENCTSSTPSIQSSIQHENGYCAGTVYWFKYEPIEFRVLQTLQGKALLLCVNVLDAQAFHTTQQATTDAGVTYYANNYEKSTLRSWLNGSFVQTAFRNIEYSRIIETVLDNSPGSTASPQGNRYACEDTEDAVFLLSYADISNAGYGFCINGKTVDEARQYDASDYAKAMGLSCKNGYSSWWLRSPCKEYSYGVFRINESGKAVDIGSVYLGGVVPALQINL